MGAAWDADTQREILRRQGLDLGGTLSLNSEYQTQSGYLQLDESGEGIMASAGDHGGECKLVDFTTSAWRHIAKASVAGSNIDVPPAPNAPGSTKSVYTDKTVDECKALCDANSQCVAFEYGVNHYAPYTQPLTNEATRPNGYRAGDCQLQSSASYQADEGVWNLDVYIKPPPQNGNGGVRVARKYCDGYGPRGRFYHAADTDTAEPGDGGKRYMFIFGGQTPAPKNGPAGGTGGFAAGDVWRFGPLDVDAPGARGIGPSTAHDRGGAWNIYANPGHMMMEWKQLDLSESALRPQLMGTTGVIHKHKFYIFSGIGGVPVEGGTTFRDSAVLGAG